MAEAHTRTPLSVAYVTEYPFSYVDEAGRLTGFDVAIMDEIAARMDGRALAWTEIRWHEVVPMLTARRFDVIVTGLAWHADRMAAGLPSEPLYCVRSMGFVPKGNPDRVHSVDDMLGGDYPVGSIVGSLELKTLKRVLGPRATDFAEEPEMWRALDTGAIRAVVFAEAAGLGHLAKHRGARFEAAAPFDFPVLPETGYFFTKDDTALKAAIDGNIRAIKEEGLLARILDRFGYPSELALPPGAVATPNLEPDA